MRPSEIKDYLKVALVKMPHRSTFIYGPVGVGKSSVIKQVTEELGWEFRDVRLSLLDATDLRGLPAVDKEKRETIWTRPTFLPPEGYDKDMLLFLDEFNTANKSLQNAALQLVLDRQIGEYKLPKNVRVICAGNRLQDGAYVMKLSAPLSNRFINLDYEINFDDWKAWALKHNIHPMIMGFHNFSKGELLYNYKEDMNTTSFASPRTWEFASEVLNIGLENGTLYEVLKGTLGEGCATEFYGFLKIYRDLPDPDAILNGKDIVPSETNIMYALCAALVNRVMKDKSKIDRLIMYSLKIQKEFSVVMVKDLLKTELRDNVMSCKAFNEWVDEHKDIVL